MQRTTIMLPDDLDARLRVEARTRGVSLAEVARQLIERGLKAQGRPRRRKLSLVGTGEGPSDLSERADDYVREILEADYERQQREFTEHRAAAEAERRRAAG
jgi:plasmid stability protein